MAKVVNSVDESKLDSETHEHENDGVGSGFVAVTEGDVVYFDTRIVKGGSKKGVLGSLHASSVLRRCGVQEREPGAEPFNFYECLFRICPKLSFKAQLEIKSSRKISRRTSLAAMSRRATRAGSFDSASQISGSQRDGASSAGGGVDREAMRAQQELLQNRAEMERRQNAVIMERTLAGSGNVVQYGSTVMLQHVQSGLFVGAFESSALRDPDCRRVSLSHGDFGCCFRLVPRYKVRSEGSAVYYGDAIVFESVAVSRHHLHVSPILYDESLEPRSQIEEKSAPTHRVRRSSVMMLSTVAENIRPSFLSNAREYEVNTSPDYSAFTIIMFSKQMPSTLISLNTMERFRLYSPQVQAFIHASCDPAKGFRDPSECRLKREFGIAAHIPYLRRIENTVDITNVRHMSAKGVWTIEFLSRMSGGSVLWDRPIRIRHVASSLYLAVDTSSKAVRQHHAEEDVGGIREDWYDAVLVDGQYSSKHTVDTDPNMPGSRSSTIFYLQANEHTKSPAVERHQVTVRIVHRFKVPNGERVRACFLHDASERKPSFVDNGSDETRKDRVGIRSGRIVFSTKRHTEDVYTLLQVDPVNTLRLDRIASCLPVAKLYTYLTESKSRMVELPTAKDVEDEIQMLLTVIADCNKRSKLERWLDDTDWVRQTEKLPAEFAKLFVDDAQPLAQRFCREIKLIDAIFEMTVAPYTREAPTRPFLGSSLKGVPEKRAMRAVQKLAYVSLQRMFANSEENQMYFARSTSILKNPVLHRLQKQNKQKWIVTLTECLEDPLGSAVTLSELLSTNEELLHTFVTEELIDNFASMIETMGPQPRLINFFAKVCAVSGKPIKSNQEKVLRRVFMYEEKRRKLLLSIIPMTGENMDFEPHAESGEYLTLASLDDTSIHAEDYLAKDETREGSCYPGIFVHWVGAPNWKQHAEAFYFPPRDLGIEQVEEGGLVRIEHFCWVLDPRHFCLIVTGEEFDEFWEGVQSDSRKMEAFEHHKQLAQYFVSQLELFAQMCLGRSCRFSII